MNKYVCVRYGETNAIRILSTDARMLIDILKDGKPFSLKFIFFDVHCRVLFGEC